MHFSGQLALKELKRNKVKLILATIISLILFMSAFLLVNLSIALPENFYSFYEENYRDELVIEITNADSKLIEDYDQYFDSFEIDYGYINNQFHIINPLGSPLDKTNEFSYMQAQDAVGGEVVKYYKGDYCKVGEISQRVASYGDRLWLEGEVWRTSENYFDIWIADIVSKKLDVKVGEKLNLMLELSDVESKTVKIENFTVAGIYDYALTQKRENNFPVFYMRGDAASMAYLDIYDEYRVKGTIKDISSFYKIYTDLKAKYNLAESTIIDMFSAVKNSEIICLIIGITMLVGGMIVLMNFITMLMSSNRQNIGIMLAIGAKYRQIVLGYSIIFASLIAIVTLISIMLLPTVNALITVFCNSMGYSFSILVNWSSIIGLYFLSNLIMAIIMIADKFIIAKMTPTQVLAEED